MAAVKKPLETVLDETLDKLVIISPDKRTYDSITSVMFQLYCGNDYGMGDNNLSFLDKVENNWRKGRKRVAKIRGLSLVKNA